MQRNFSVTLVVLLALAAMTVARFNLTPRQDATGAPQRDNRGDWSPTNQKGHAPGRSGREGAYDGRNRNEGGGRTGRENAAVTEDNGVRSSKVFYNQHNPGRCTITPVVILHPGETARDPEGRCGRLRCLDRRGNVEVTACRLVAPAPVPPNCVLDTTLAERVLYPGCCEQRFNCTTAL